MEEESGSALLRPELAKPRTSADPRQRTRTSERESTWVEVNPRSNTWLLSNRKNLCDCSNDPRSFDSAADPITMISAVNGGDAQTDKRMSGTGSNRLPGLYHSRAVFANNEWNEFVSFSFIFRLLRSRGRQTKDPWDSRGISRNKQTNDRNIPTGQKVGITPTLSSCLIYP